MEKLKIAICMEEKEYKTRFVRCVMSHYKESYEIYLMDEMEKASEMEFDIILLDDEQKIHVAAETNQMCLFLSETNHSVENSSEDTVFYTEKYQEVYKIMDKVKEITDRKGDFGNVSKRNTKARFIGVFSLERESMQIPFTALLAEILGETKQVLVADIQPFSGMLAELEPADILGLEDMMSVAATGNYTISRLNGSIGHEQKWDFIYPVKNSSCLAEADETLYQKMFEILEKEKGYECIIINFGTIFSGMPKLMMACDFIYVLSAKRKTHSQREQAFLMEMKRQGMEALIQKIIWIALQEETGLEDDWKALEKEWLWSELGDSLRKRNWTEKNDG